MYCWVGIIMYLPTEDPVVRSRIRDRFEAYCAVEAARFPRFQAYSHWAKLEVPHEAGAAEEMRARLRQRYPIVAFNRARRELDPHGVLANEWVDNVFGNPWAEEEWG